MDRHKESIRDIMAISGFPRWKKASTDKGINLNCITNEHKGPSLVLCYTDAGDLPLQICDTASQASPHSQS